jgi:hypothetical protein
MSLVQKAFGIDSATFPVGTQAGNCIAVLVACNAPGNDIQLCSDDMGQLYFQSPQHAESGGPQTFWYEVWFGAPNNGTLPGVRTVTVTSSNGGCQVWIYEFTPISTIGLDTVYDAYDFNVGTSANPTGSGLFNSNNLGTQHIYFAVCAVGPGTVLSVGAGWTLDTIQDGNAVAYFDNSTGDKTVAFTCTPSSLFAISEVDFYIPGGTPPSCQLAVSPSSLTFTAAVGGSNPASQNVTVTNTGGGGAVPFTFTASQSWITPNSGSGLTAGVVAIDVNIAGLGKGTYTGTVTFNSSCGSPPVSVAITLTITGTTPPCVVLNSQGAVISTFFPDLSLNVAPATELYRNVIPNSVINSYETYNEGRPAIVMDFDSGDGLYARDLGTIFTWPMTSRTILRTWQPSLIPMPESIYGRASDWDNAGSPGNKFIQGVMVAADSFGNPKTFFLQDSDTKTLHQLNECPVAFNLNTEDEVAFSCVPFTAHSARLISTDGVEWRVWSSRLIFQPWPESTLNWQTEMTSLGLVGWGHLRETNIAYVSTTQLTLVLTFDAWPTINVTLPSSNGVQNKTKVTLPANKFKLVGFQVYSTAKFNLFEGDIEVKVKQWGSAGEYQVIKPFGGQSRVGAIV